MQIRYVEENSQVRCYNQEKNDQKNDQKNTKSKARLIQICVGDNSYIFSLEPKRAIDIANLDKVQDFIDSWVPTGFELTRLHYPTGDELKSINNDLMCTKVVENLNKNYFFHKTMLYDKADTGFQKVHKDYSHIFRSFSEVELIMVEEINSG